MGCPNKDKISFNGLYILSLISSKLPVNKISRDFCMLNKCTVKEPPNPATSEISHDDNSLSLQEDKDIII